MNEAGKKLGGRPRRFMPRPSAAALVLGLSALTAASGCSPFDFGRRLDALERDQAALDEQVAELTSRQGEFGGELAELSDRQDALEVQVTTWVRRLGGRSGPLSPRLAPIPASYQATLRVGPERRLVRAGVSAVLYENGTDRVMKVRAAPGPGLASETPVRISVLPSDGDETALEGPVVVSVPCGARLVAAAENDRILFVSAEPGERCAPVPREST